MSIFNCQFICCRGNKLPGGLIVVDCHMHMVLDGDYWRAAMGRHEKEPDIPWIRKQLETYRDRGFTWLRDGGDRLGAGKAARELAPEYGITYRTPLSPLHFRGHYGGFIGTCFGDWKEYAALVKKTRADGGDFIKVMISGLMDFDRFGVLTEAPLTPEQIRMTVEIAHGEGMAIMLHANGARTVEAAAEAGADSIEHGAYLDMEALRAMKEADCVWVPTLSTVGNLRGNGRFCEDAVRKILASALENVKTFAEMGGLLAPGTDAGAWAVPHGSVTEYELFSGIGIGPERLEPGIRMLQNKF